ncbi:carbohydrate-binding module family 13 [Piromyces sp. E2]|nr:carbohydrate-binding module family 13 [Piromyces sp. E2]|eukprot:OUM64473.1 carbohydrate-binding module family 13 [Piromyces sp. E2]
MKSLTFLSSLFIYLLLASPFVLVKAAHKLVVDCDNKLRKATHCANGSLYGFTENIPSEANYMTLVDDLHPYVMRNPARGKPGNQHPFGDAIQVAKRLSRTPGALVSVDLADILPYWPYQWPGMQKWLDEVRSFIRDKKAAGITNLYGYEIWNEAENTWRDSNGYTFFEMWKQTYKVIREMDPDEKIIGPCDGLYSEERMRPFLQFCLDNDVMPDIMCWHELMGVELIPRRYKAYRELERSLGIKELPITINEYCDIKHELEGQPGSSARFIGKFERYKIESALISWWFVPLPGHLGSLLATDSEKGAGWYFYKWYGDMTGDMVYVKPPNDNSVLVDGAASVDSDEEYISFIFGGPNDGTINASFINLPDFIGDVAKVKFEKIDWVSKDTVSYGPKTVFEKKYAVVDGQITIGLTNCNASSGYRLYITKGDHTGEIEESTEVPTIVIPDGTYRIINRNSGKALTVVNDSKDNSASVVQNTYSGKASQHWKIIDDGGYSFTNVNANKVIDIERASLEDGGNVIIWPDTAGANQRFLIENAEDGYVYIINLNSNKVLDVANNSKAEGGNVLQWTITNGTNQQWQFIPVGSDTPLDLTPRKTTKTSKPTSTPTSTPSKTCSEAILKQGYKCCSKDCVVVFTDNDGTWGIENNEWCGCGNVVSCPVSITSQGYKCCKENNCSVVETDADGNWGIEDNEWCGISNKC